MSDKKKEQEEAVGTEGAELDVDETVLDGTDDAADEDGAADGVDDAADEGGDATDASQDDVEQLKDRLLRMNADFDNFRKRTQREKLEWGAYASQSMIEKLLPVADNMDAAMAAVVGAGEEARNVADGFVMIYKQLMDVLTNEGLTEIPALGEAFDPNVHEAIMMTAREEGQADNEVVMVVRKGYMYKDKVLRPAMVQVAKD